MFLSKRGIQRTFGVPLSALLLFLSATVPLLDMADLRTDVVVESQHDPASCAPSHDHTICTQAGANHALPHRTGVRTPVVPLRTRAPLGVLGTVPSSVLADGHPTRGPPSA